MKVVENASGIVEERDLTLDRMLLYIRGGTVFARKDIARRSSTAMKYDPFTIIVALNSDGEAHGNLYIDDGDSFEYQKSMAFAKIQFSARFDEENKLLTLDLDVEGESSLLPESILRSNKIILLTPSAIVELPINLYLGESKLHEFKL